MRLSTSNSFTSVTSSVVTAVVWILLCVTDVGETVLVRTKFVFSSTELIPAISHQSAVRSDLESFEQCLLACSRRTDCLTIVYESGTCSLYASDKGTEQKTAEQVVAKAIQTERITDSEVCEKLTPCKNGGTCSRIAVYPYYKCQCIEYYVGDMCERVPPIPALFAQESYITLPDGTDLPVLSEDGWIVLFRRKDGSVIFHSRTWEEFKTGFGELHGEFWLGNKWVYLLTSDASYRLRFDMVTHDGRTGYAEYSTFSIGPETANFTIHIGSFSGNVFNAMQSERPECNQNGMPFSTPDHMSVPYIPCCGGFWLNLCSFARLNGKYNVRFDSWDNALWYQFSRRLSYIDMKIKRN